MNLDDSLRQFDTVEANLAKLESIWTKAQALVPQGIAFMSGSPEDRQHRQLLRDYSAILKGLPAIDGWRITATPWGLDAIAQARLDSQEIGEVEAEIMTEQGIAEPSEQIDEYRSRLAEKRRVLVRQRLDELVADVDTILNAIDADVENYSDPRALRSPEWERMESLIKEIDRLFGSAPRGKAWNTLWRHLGFAQAVDLGDLVQTDWPWLKSEIARLTFAENEPVPVAVVDLGDLVAARPAGKVSTALAWSSLDDDGFERLLFAILDDASGYENPSWLMKTRAPDRGRDLSVSRVRDDSLSGVSRERVIIQCKHWQEKSVADTDIANTVTKMVHWEPPPVDVLAIATSGRFTADAVSWVERHNHAGKRPRLELWAESQLERLLAQRPHLVAEFRLR